MKIVKSMIKETSSVVKATELWDNFLSYYTGKIAQISGPFISLVEGRSSLPDHIISGSVIIEDGTTTDKSTGSVLSDEALIIYC